MSSTKKRRRFFRSYITRRYKKVPFEYRFIPNSYRLYLMTQSKSLTNYFTLSKIIGKGKGKLYLRKNRTVFMRSKGKKLKHYPLESLKNLNKLNKLWHFYINQNFKKHSFPMGGKADANLNNNPESPFTSKKRAEISFPLTGYYIRTPLENQIFLTKNYPILKLNNYLNK